MSPALWIIILLLVVLPIMRGSRRNRAQGGSFACSFLIVAAIVAACTFFRVSQNRSPFAHINLPTIQIHVPPVRVAQNATRMTTHPSMRLTAPAIPPTTQISDLWIENWSEFNNSTHWQGFRAESSETSVTEAEARQEAINDASTKLSQQIIADSSIGHDAIVGTDVTKLLRDHIASRLQNGEFIADQFVKKIDKPYGTLYKAYLLIDASPSTESSIKQSALGMLAQVKSTELTTFGSIAVLFLVIILLYAFLNAATKGYFVWKLRAAAMMVLIFVILAMMAWLK